jgi:polysaccharide pyruvyl transferase WcaK-like protein
MACIFYGAYGAGNLGDDLILVAAIDEYAASDYKVVCYGEPRIGRVVPTVEVSEFLRRPFEHISAGDLFVVGGGGVFWSSEHIECLYQIAQRCKSAGVGFHLRKIGAQGVQFNLSCCVKLFEIADLVTFRDEDSGRIAEEYLGFARFKVESDYVFSLATYVRDRLARSARRGPRKFRVAINHAQTSFYEDPDFRYKLIRIYKMVAELFGADVQFIYVSQVRHKTEISQNDVIAAEIFSVMTGGAVKATSFPETTDMYIDQFVDIDLFVGCRYHAQVIAKIIGASCILLTDVEAGAKYEAFAREHGAFLIDVRKGESVIVEELVELVRYFYSRWLVAARVAG